MGLITPQKRSTVLTEFINQKIDSHFGYHEPSSESDESLIDKSDDFDLTSPRVPEDDKSSSSSSAEISYYNHDSQNTMILDVPTEDRPIENSEIRFREKEDQESSLFEFESAQTISDKPYKRKRKEPKND
jgi:hypothetical protein